MIDTNSSDNKGYDGVRVFVLGASGFIGRWVARALCAQGAEVCLSVRDKGPAEAVFRRYGVQGEIIEADLADAKVVKELFQKIKPTITFNLTGYGVKPGERDEEAAHRINTHLVEVLCEAVAQVRDPKWQGQDILHVGSALEYGTIGGNLSEDSTPNPTTAYGRTKLAGTNSLSRACKSEAIRGLTARLFTVYGPGEHEGRLLPSLLDAARTGKSLKLTSANQKRDFTYVEDVAEGLLRCGLATTKPREIVNLATGRLTTVRCFVETAARILQISGARLKFGALPTRCEEMEHDEVAVEHLQQLLGWAPSVTIEQGIRKTADFERPHVAAESTDLTPPEPFNADRSRNANLSG